MIALLQRVAQAGVTVDGKTVGEVGRGLCILVCAVKGDTEEKARALAQKVLRYRIFEDDAGKMNRSVSDIVGQLLLVSQFTLAADTSRGNRPSFTPAAAPEDGKRLFDIFVEECAASGLKTATGIFGAHMVVNIVNRRTGDHLARELRAEKSALYGKTSELLEDRRAVDSEVFLFWASCTDIKSWKEEAFSSKFWRESWKKTWKVAGFF